MFTPTRVFSFTLVLTLWCGAWTMRAQAPFCDTVTDSAFTAYFDAMRGAVPDGVSTDDSAWVLVPVLFHAQSDAGSPAVDETRVRAAMAAVNAWYAPGRIRFEQCGPVLIYPKGSSSPSKRRVINVYVARAESGCGAYSGTISININCNRSFENILSHELGHALGLPHTHGLTNMGTTDELADGSNCASAGDRFCDTPADPNLLGKVDGACRYVGTARDARGNPYTPNTANIMSYSNTPCMTYFSPQQFAAARDIGRRLNYECCLLPAPTARDTAVCPGTAVTLTASSGAREILWYDAPGGGTPVARGGVFTTPPLFSTTAWFVEAVDSCVSERTRILATVQAGAPLSTDFATLVTGISSGGKGSQPSSLIVSDTSLFFIARPDTTVSIWRLDAASRTPRRIWSMPASTPGTEATQYLHSLAVWKGRLFWGLNDRTAGPSLWTSNGEPGDATRILFVPLPAGAEAFSNFWLTPARDFLIFMLNDGRDRTTLWRSDGTPAGTRSFAALPGSSAFIDFNFTPLDGGVFFTAADSLHGKELWFTDGSDAGTTRVADIAPGSKDANPDELTVFRGRVYFTADDSTGHELWSSDGTLAGTQQVADINSAGSAAVTGLRVLDGALHFSAKDGSSGTAPYVSDGTSFGTRKAADPVPGAYAVRWLGTVNGARLFVVSSSGSGDALWRVDSTAPGGAVFVARPNPGGYSSISDPAVLYRNRLVFTASDGTHGSELWFTDGTERGTGLLADIDTAGASMPSSLTPFAGTVVFAAGVQQRGADLYYLDATVFSVCNGGTLELRTGGAGGAQYWYDAPSGGAPLAMGPVFRTPPLRRSTIYYTDYRVGACTSARAAFPVHVRGPDPLVRDTVVARGAIVDLRAYAESGSIEWCETADSSRVVGKGPLLRIGPLERDTSFLVRTVEDGCTSPLLTVRVRVDGGTGLGSPVPDETLLVFPQPADDRLHVSRGMGALLRVRLLTLLGLEVAVAGDGTPAATLDLHTAGLPAGVYLLEVDARGWRLVIVRR
ncbi:MAG: hypothetical protein HY962_12275 [Ignavibacteriae bacterium]|nr:hypothetical protein [Ignavibacteriota bacterium]